MYNSLHEAFITTPLMGVLKDGIIACSSIRTGAESYTLGEYFFQSLFLRMTGTQEQKMKCIYWELATNDYVYRYELMNSKNYGECSNYSEKCSIYKDIISQIKKIQSYFSTYRIWDDVKIPDAEKSSERVKWENKIKTNWEKQIADAVKKQEEKIGGMLSQEKKDKIRLSITSRPLPEEDFTKHLAAIRKRKAIDRLVGDVIHLLASSNIILWKQREFDDFSSLWGKQVQSKQIAPSDVKLFETKLQKLYETVVYAHRNRCAHNTTSYQQDLPSLDTIAENDYYLQNYYYRFTLLIIIDEVFMRLYKYYRCVSNDAI